MKQLTKVPRSLLDDVLIYMAKHLSPRERDDAVRELSTTTPSEDGTVSYEGAVYVLGLRQHERAAMALIRYMGNTSAVLTLSPNQDGETTKLEKLFWPGDVECAKNLSVGGGYVGGALTVGGALRSTNLLYGGELKVGGPIIGDRPMNIPTTPGRLPRMDGAIDIQQEPDDSEGLLAPA